MSMRFKKTKGIDTRRQQGFKDGYNNRSFRFVKLKKERRHNPTSSLKERNNNYVYPEYMKAYYIGQQYRAKKRNTKKLLRTLVFVMAGLFVSALLLATLK